MGMRVCVERATRWGDGVAKSLMNEGEVMRNKKETRRPDTKTGKTKHV